MFSSPFLSSSNQFSSCWSIVIHSFPALEFLFCLFCLFIFQLLTDFNNDDFISSCLWVGKVIWFSSILILHFYSLRPQKHPMIHCCNFEISWKLNYFDLNKDQFIIISLYKFSDTIRNWYNNNIIAHSSMLVNGNITNLSI